MRQRAKTRLRESRHLAIFVQGNEFTQPSLVFSEHFRDSFLKMRLPNLLILLALAITLVVPSALCLDVEEEFCFEQFECDNATVVAERALNSPQLCFAACKQTGGCKWWTHYQVMKVE